MPSPDETTTPAADPAANPPAAETPAAPATVTVTQEQWDRVNAQLAHMGGVIETLQGQASRAHVAPPPTPPPRRYTDDELVEMLESGDSRKVLAANRIIIQQQVDPLVADYTNFRAAGMDQLAGMHREIAEARGKLPFATDTGVKKAMDDFLGQLPPEARANAQAIELAYAHAVARPENMQRIIDQQVEAKLRERGGGTEAGSDVTPAGGRLPERAGDAIPTVTELMGPQMAQRLRRQGRSPDEWVRKAFKGRYKSWAEYAKEIQKERDEDFNDDNEEAV